LASLLAGASKSGSNCLAVSSTKTGTDSAMLAADPHLGLTLPNMWLVAGGRSPSYHMVGLMFPGLPFAGVGRNPHAAWGGTNMRAASSDLYDVSGLSPGEFQVRRETIRIRWWPDKTITIRDTNWGPVISDAPVFRKYTGPPLALNWMGHRPSDELTSFLDAARAESFRDFRRAFQGYAVSGQNMLYADDKGHIGQVLAVRLPIRPADRPPDLILDPDDPASGWRGAVDAADLPAAYDPPAGFLASANNLPVKNNPPVGFLYRDNDRIRRMTALMDRAETVDFRTLAAVQRDVLSPVAIDLRDALVGLAEDRRLAPKAHEPAAELWSRLTGWDGAYRLDSRGAPAFEILVYYFSRAYYAETIGPRAAETLTQSMDLIEILVLDLKRDRRRGDLDAAAGALALALDLAPSDAARRPVWADMHRVELAHVFGRLPLVGRKYRLVEFAAPGSRSTLYKTAQNVDNKPHTAAYGSNARFICDLSDINENYFVLLGGQDGRPGGRRTVDQVPIWRRGEYIRVPLDFSRAGETFEYRLDLKPNR
jgi:penicillin amidase